MYVDNLAAMAVSNEDTPEELGPWTECQQARTEAETSLCNSRVITAHRQKVNLIQRFRTTPNRGLFF